MKLTWRVLCVACLLSLAVAAVAQPAGPVLLRFKFTPGHVDALNLSVTGYGTIVLTGVPVLTNLSVPVRIWANVPISLRIDKVDAQGNATMSLSVGALGMEVRAAGRTTHVTLGAGPGPVVLSNDGMQVPGVKMGEALKQLSWVISPQGKILVLNGMDKFAAALQLPMAEMLAGLSQEQVLQMAQAKSPLLPDDPINVGDSWVQNLVLPLPGGEAVQSPITYTLEKVGHEDGHYLARLGLAGSLELKNLTLPAPPATPQMQGLPGLMAGMASTLDRLSTVMTGQMYIPLDGGYLHSARMAVDLSVDTSTVLSAALGGSTMHASVQDMRIFYDLTPGK